MTEKEQAEHVLKLSKLIKNSEKSVEHFNKEMNGTHFSIILNNLLEMVKLQNELIENSQYNVETLQSQIQTLEEKTDRLEVRCNNEFGREDYY